MILVLLTIAYALIMTAVGAWPAVLIGRRQPLLALLAPIYGIALSAGLLTGLSVVMTMRTAAFAVLLPLALASLAGAVLSLRRGAVDVRRIDAGISIGLVVLGCVIALAAPLRAGSGGPLAVGVFDSLGYTATDIWLRDKQSDAQPATAPTDLRDAVGWFYVIEPQRIGVSSVNAAVGSLLRTGPDRTFQAMLTLFFALVALVAFVLARMLRAPPLAAAMGAAFGLSAAVLSLVADTTTANLGALSLYPALLAVAAWGATHRDWRAIPVAGLLAAGCMAVYPELAPPFIAIAVLGAIALSYRAWRRGGLLDWLTDVLSGTIGALALAVLITPDGAHRALAYLASFLDKPTDALSDLPPRFLSLDNIGGWAFGLLHLYQLQWFQTMSQPKQIVAILLPLLLLIVVVVGIVQRRLSTWMLILVPIVVSAILARSAYGRFQGGACEYCAWKSLTFALPFIAAGIGVGLGRALAGRRAGHRLRQALAAGAGVVVLAGLAGVAYGDAKLISALVNSPNAYTDDLRAITDATSRVNTGIAIEGLQARGSDILDVGLVALLAARDGRRPPSFDPGAPGIAYITPAKPERLAYWDPDYGSVVTAFPGIRTGRTRVDASGRYALDIRRPVDAVISRTGVAIDPSEGDRAIAWVTSPFQVTVTRRRDVPVALTFSLTRPRNSRATIVLRRDGVLAPVVRAAGGTVVCTTVPRGASVEVLDVQPVIGRGGGSRGRARITDPVPPPAKALGIRGLTAAAGTCPATTSGAALPPAYRGTGWWVPEPGAPGDRDFAWMKPGRGQILVGDPGSPRPAVRIRFQATSFSVPRTVTARLDGRGIGAFTAPSTEWSLVTLDVPAGTGVAQIFLSPDPGAQMVSTDPRGDTRRVSIGVSSPEALLQPGG